MVMQVGTKRRIGNAPPSEPYVPNRLLPFNLGGKASMGLGLS